MLTTWITFSYSLPTHQKSSARVTVWRRLKRLGAISPIGGISLLPGSDRCVEALQWLAQEVEKASGQAILMHVDRFDGISDETLIEQFQQARSADYAELNKLVDQLAAALPGSQSGDDPASLRDELGRLRLKLSEIQQVDYFNSYEGQLTTARIEQLTRKLQPDPAPNPTIVKVDASDYQARTWVTRPQPHVDRLASAWLIRRFIDPQAALRYSHQPEPGQVSFDMSEADFGHSGSLCTFETLIQAFQLDAQGLNALAELVHQIDLPDERFTHPEAVGIDAILRGWLAETLSDEALEQRGLALFDGIYQTLKGKTLESH
jgi:hypothetical protein